MVWSCVDGVLKLRGTLAGETEAEGGQVVLASCPVVVMVVFAQMYFANDDSDNALGFADQYQPMLRVRKPANGTTVVVLEGEFRMFQGTKILCLRGWITDSSQGHEGRKQIFR